MSRRARARAAAVAAKHVALAQLPEHDDYDEPDELECPHCHDDGMDPMTDYLLPCPVCQGEHAP